MDTILLKYPFLRNLTFTTKERAFEEKRFSDLPGRAFWKRREGDFYEDFQTFFFDRAGEVIRTDAQTIPEGVREAGESLGFVVTTLYQEERVRRGPSRSQLIITVFPATM